MCENYHSIHLVFFLYLHLSDDLPFNFSTKGQLFAIFILKKWGVPESNFYSCVELKIFWNLSWIFELELKAKLVFCKVFDSPTKIEIYRILVIINEFDFNSIQINEFSLKFVKLFLALFHGNNHIIGLLISLIII